MSPAIRQHRNPTPAPHLAASLASPISPRLCHPAPISPFPLNPATPLHALGSFCWLPLGYKMSCPPYLTCSSSRSASYGSPTSCPRRPGQSSTSSRSPSSDTSLSTSRDSAPVWDCLCMAVDGGVCVCACGGVKRKWKRIVCVSAICGTPSLQRMLRPTLHPYPSEPYSPYLPGILIRANPYSPVHPPPPLVWAGTYNTPPPTAHSPASCPPVCSSSGSWYSCSSCDSDRPGSGRPAKAAFTAPSSRPTWAVGRAVGWEGRLGGWEEWLGGVVGWVGGGASG